MGKERACYAWIEERIEYFIEMDESGRSIEEICKKLSTSAEDIFGIRVHPVRITAVAHKIAGQEWAIALGQLVAAIQYMEKYCRLDTEIPEEVAQGFLNWTDQLKEYEEDLYGEKLLRILEEDSTRFNWTPEDFNHDSIIVSSQS